MKIVKATGLAPILFPEGKDSYAAGTIAGLLPKDGLEAIAKGYGTQDFEFPDDVEFVEYDPDASDEASEGKPEETETEWRKMRFLSQHKLAVENGYDGEKKGEPVKAFLEAKFPA